MFAGLFSYLRNRCVKIKELGEREVTCLGDLL